MTAVPSRSCFFAGTLIVTADEHTTLLLEPLDGGQWKMQVLVDGVVEGVSVVSDRGRHLMLSIMRSSQGLPDAHRVAEAQCFIGDIDRELFTTLGAAA